MTSSSSGSPSQPVSGRTGGPTLRVLPTGDDVAEAAAQEIARSLADAVRDRGVAHWATTGGSVAPPVYRLLRVSPLREAVDWAEDTALAAEDAVLLAGASLLDHPELEDLDLTVEPAGSVETRAALPQVRALVRARKLAHDGDGELAASVLGARVPPNVTGDAMLIRGDALLRCVAWTVHRAHRERW